MDVTLKDVAEKAGVSMSTVSRIINNDKNKPASKKTSERVWKIVRELGYVPNMNARNLIKGHETSRRNKTKAIGCILASSKESFQDAFFAHIMAGIQSEAASHGYVLGYTFSFSEGSNALYDNIKSNQVDGTIVLGRFNEDFLVFLKNNLKNLVYAGLNSVSGGFDEVICDAYKASCCAVEHIISLGHIKLGYIGPIRSKSKTDVINEYRFKGFCDTLQKNNLELNMDYVKNTGHFTVSGYDAMKTLLEENNIPTAVFCANDNIAIGVMKAIHKHNLKVPKDVAVVGLTNIEVSEYVRPSLTTVDVPKEDIGRFAVKMLIDKIENGHNLPVRIELPFRLIVRESCGGESKNGGYQ